MDGWMSVEDVVRHGFDRSTVVMANEAHDGMRRCVRTREVGVRMVQAAHAVGVRRMAMEALPWPAKDVPGPIRNLPDAAGGYLDQPEMRTLVGVAIDLGWTLWAYEMQIEYDQGADLQEFLTLSFTNRREQEQATNLLDVVRRSPGEPLLVWCGNGHATKEPVEDWTPMGWHFRQLAEIDPFVIDQTVTVQWDGPHEPGVGSALEALSGVLGRHGGVAGILADRAPDPWGACTGVDAVVVAVDNDLT